MEERYKLAETDVDCSEKDLARIVFLSARLRHLRLGRDGYSRKAITGWRHFGAKI